jgi:hypothetical protein
MAKQRKGVTATFEERLAEEAIKFKEAAEKQPLGSAAREQLLRRVRQAETAAHIDEWLRSPGLLPPTSLENLLSDQKKWGRPVCPRGSATSAVAQRPSRCSTRLRLLPTFLTAFFTAPADLLAFFAA